MRLKSLTLPRFKNLKDFTVDFDDGHPVSVVVGRNGTGKSNLIEALTIIFRDLDLAEPPAFAYELSYECRGQLIEIMADPSAHTRTRVRVNGERGSLRRLRQEGDQRLLPDFVFGYYSGPSNRLRVHFEKHQESFSRALRDGHERPLRRLFYAQPIHSQFVLLAFFLQEEPDELVRDLLRLDSLDSILFVLQEPYWSPRRSRRLGQGDSRFWNARGAVAQLLAELHAVALAPMRRVVDVPLEHGRRERREHLYLYLPDLAAMRNLAKARYLDEPQELFKAFESILAADLLSEVRIRVRTVGGQDTLVFRELSEGEQQLLMVLGLLRFTRGDESLFLLDEPDTHLNPAWSMDYVSLLEQSAGPVRSSSQLIMATHDPLVIASLVREQVILLERPPMGGEVSAQRPEQDPRGMGVSGLLTSDIYDLVSELDPITLKKLERRRWLAAAEHGELSASEREELQELTMELEDLEFNFTTRDPLYNEFERAMISLDRLNKTRYEPGEAKAERREALRAASRVRGQGLGDDDLH